jgi:hypothetical protein
MPCRLRNIFVGFLVFHRLGAQFPVSEFLPNLTGAAPCVFSLQTQCSMTCLFPLPPTPPHPSTVYTLIRKECKWPEFHCLVCLKALTTSRQICASLQQGGVAPERRIKDYSIEAYRILTNELALEYIISRKRNSKFCCFSFNQP